VEDLPDFSRLHTDETFDKLIEKEDKLEEKLAGNS
jgi:hypothetical protein